MVGVMGFGVMRVAFEAALNTPKTTMADGIIKILQHQYPADLLIAIKNRAGTTRLLTWIANHALDTRDSGAVELCYTDKVYTCEAAVASVMEALRVVERM